jgi:hypothetical protein
MTFGQNSLVWTCPKNGCRKFTSKNFKLVLKQGKEGDQKQDGKRAYLEL